MATKHEWNPDYVKLVCRRLYDAQKLRIQSDARMQRLVREGVVLKEDAEQTFARAAGLELAIEKEYARILWREIRHTPIVTQWLSRVHGIGPRLSGLLVANIITPARFANIGKLWAYSGLHVVGGAAAKRKKGVKANWSSELKTTAWKIGESFIKSGGPYRELYDTYKKYLIVRELRNGEVIWQTVNDKLVVAHISRTGQTDEKTLKELVPPEVPKWTMGHLHNMALRRTVKIFLSHLWAVWRELEGLPVTAPYAGERLGHSGMLDPWDFVKPEVH